MFHFLIDVYFDYHRIKKRKAEVLEDAVYPQSSASRGEPAETSGEAVEELFNLLIGCLAFYPHIKQICLAFYQDRVE